jgi:hypothetical protein
MIAEIFRRIGVSSKRFVEIGVSDGMECNTAFLLVQGWTGAWIERDERLTDKAREAFKEHPVDIACETVTAENADNLATAHAHGELDLLSIDIDGNDYWVWKAITGPRPRVVVIEYNSGLPADMRKTVPYDPERSWDFTWFVGASLGALAALGREKGYSLVGCSLTGVNAFFVRDDLVGDHFCAPFTPANHYEPPRVELLEPVFSPGVGRWVDV